MTRPTTIKRSPGRNGMKIDARPTMIKVPPSNIRRIRFICGEGPSLILNLSSRMEMIWLFRKIFGFYTEAFVNPKEKEPAWKRDVFGYWQCYL